MNPAFVCSSMRLALALVAGAGPEVADRPEPVLASVIVSTHARDTQTAGDLVALAAGQDAGMCVGARFWIFGPEGVVADGLIRMVTSQHSVGRCRRPIAQSLENLPAVVLDPARFSRLRDFLPESVSLQGTVRRAAPGRQTAWIDLGRRHGLRDGDGVLVRRLGLPIARGRVELLDEDGALVVLRPLVSNALPEAGDPVELWPGSGDQRQGRLTTAVLDVRPGADGPWLTLAGTARDGLRAGYMVDLYRTDRYVGVAVIEEPGDPLSAARLIEAASVQTPQVGDIAIVRPGPQASGFPLGAAIFKIAEDNYGLVAAGESDDVQVSERWVVRRPVPEDPTRWQIAAELAITTVKVNHCGATVHPLDSQAARVLPWEWAERPEPPWPHWVSVGRVSAGEPADRWAVAELASEVDVGPGAIVRWAAPPGEAAGTLGHRPCGGGVVLHVDARRMVFYVPPGWGPTESLAGAELEVRATLLPADPRE